MALGYRSRASVASPHPQRHITVGATEEIKLDGYCAVGVKSDGRVSLFSRRRKSFDHHYPLIVEALGELPGGTVDLNECGRYLLFDVTQCGRLHQL